MKWIKNLFNKHYFYKLINKHRGNLINGVGIVKLSGKTIIFNCRSVTRNVSFIKSDTITIDGVELYIEESKNENFRK